MEGSASQEETDQLLWNRVKHSLQQLTWQTILPLMSPKDYRSLVELSFCTSGERKERQLFKRGLTVQTRTTRNTTAQKGWEKKKSSIEIESWFYKNLNHVIYLFFNYCTWLKQFSDPTTNTQSLIRSATLIRNSPNSSESSGIPCFRRKIL